MSIRYIDLCAASSMPRSRAKLVRDLMLTAGAMVGFAGVAQAQTAAADPAAPQGAAPATPNTAAQPADPQASEAQAGSSGEITITGYRQSIEASLRTKREANAFIDVITAEDVGKFPDKNVADALQRVPGVVITRDGGEGSRVSIRGLDSDLTLTELNGNFIAGTDTGDPSRSFNYLLLPSSMIGSVEVFKSPEARLDEGGVGGTVILRTRRPLDLKPWSGFVSAEGTDSDVTDKVEPQLTGQLSWHNEAGTIGLLVGGSWQKRTNREMDGSTESWQWWADGGRNGKPATDVNGNVLPNQDAITYWSEDKAPTTRSGQHYNGYWAPQSVDEQITTDKRERIGIQATVDIKPFDNLRLTFNYFRFQLNRTREDSQLKIPEWGYGNFFTGAKFDKSGTVMESATFEVPPAGQGCSASTPICTMETPQLAGIYQREKQISNTYDLHGDWNLGHLAVSFAVGKTKSTGGPYQQMKVAVKPRLTGAVTQNGNFLSSWDFSGGDLGMTFSPDVQKNLLAGIAQVDTGSTGSGYTNSSIEQRYAQIDVTRSFDDSFISSIQVGGKWRDGRVQRSKGELDWYADPATLLRFQDTPQGAVAQPSFFYSNPITNIPGGFTASSYPAINMVNYLNYLNTTYGPAVKVPQPQNLYRIGEKIWAGYAQLNFKSGPIRGNIGIRIANTKQTGRSTDTLYFEKDYCVDGPGGPFDPNRPIGPDGNCQVIPQSQREVRAFSANNESKSYTDVLPSFNISWDVTPNLLVRAAVSKVVARPSYNDLASARSLTFRSDAYTFDRAQFGERAGWSGDGGNFNLSPFSAWAYDIGAEWYFHPGSVLGVAAFRKDVKDFVVPVVLDLNQTVQGQTVLVQSYSTQANGSSAKSEGVEVYAQHTLSFGLGAQVNFTYNHTSVADVSLDGKKIGTSPLVGSAKTQWNASIFYEKGPVLLRASYNRRGERVGDLVSGLNVYDDPYQQVDLNASFEVFHNFTITGAVINLTKETERSHLGNDTTARYYSSKYTGRRFYLGASYKF